MASNVVTTVAAAPNATPNNRTSQAFWRRLFVKISSLYGWFSERFSLFNRMKQEVLVELAEEDRLLCRLPACAVSLPTLPSFERFEPFFPGTPDEFPQFSLLPPELRQLVWTEALPAPRLLMLQLPRRSNPGSKLICRAPPPTLLQVNQESRAVALRRYRFGLLPQDHYHRNDPGAAAERPRGTGGVGAYVDFDRDVIGLSDAVLLSSRGQALLRQLPDLRTRIRHVCLGSATAQAVFSGPVSGLLGIQTVWRRHREAAAWLFENDGASALEDVAVVESLVFGEGRAPTLAAVDWEFWIEWQCEMGRGKWVYLKGDGRWRTVRMG